MYAALESALISHLADCLPGEPVHNTFDVPDLSSSGSPAAAMQVVWLGAAITGRKRHEVKLSHRFAVFVYVDAARARPVDRAAATTAMHDALQRLLAFEPERLSFAEMQDIPAPEYDGRALRLALYFTLQDVAARAAPTP